MSKALVIKGLDASGSPLGKINFVVEPQDLTSQIKWEGKLGGFNTAARIFTIQGYSGGINAYAGLFYSAAKGSVGVLDVTEFQGATIEIKCYPLYIGDVADGVRSNNYVCNLFASAISKTQNTEPTFENPIVDEGISIIPIGSSRDYFCQKLSVFNMASASSTEEQAIKQLTVPSVASGHIYLIFTNNNPETEFSGYVKVV